VAGRRLHLHVDDAELARRRAAWQAPAPAMDSGYWKLYIDHVLQADQGADLDFLVGKRGAAAGAEGQPLTGARLPHPHDRRDLCAAATAVDPGAHAAGR
jgi:hypothetical protein